MQIESSCSNQNFKSLKLAKDMVFKQTLAENKTIQEAAKKFNIKAYETKQNTPMQGFVYNIIMEVTSKAKSFFKKPNKGAIRIICNDSIHVRGFEKEINKLKMSDFEKSVAGQTTINKVVRRDQNLVDIMRDGRAEISYKNLDKQI